MVGSVKFLVQGLFALLLAASTVSVVSSAPLESFLAGEFNEQNRWVIQEGGARVLINAPLALERKTRHLILYATPNGSTIEQTFGCKISPGSDWKLDIQHVGAQVRQLRELDKSRDIILAVVQAPELSWPAFRKDNPRADSIIASLVENLARDYSSEPITLTGHSGGGSFILGSVNAGEKIPSTIGRIAFLDANYSFSQEQGHGKKMHDWLKGDSSRSLVVIAYDDREVMLNGKKVVGPEGGTFRATVRMLQSFKEVAFEKSMLGPFSATLGMNGQARFYVHPNPEVKILHTALVGEMNGLLQALTVNTPLEGKWGAFGGPRAYSKFIQEKPQAMPRGKAILAKTTEKVKLKLPSRKAGAKTGSEFLEIIRNLPREERETAALKEILDGNMPNFLRTLVPVQVQATTPKGEKIQAVIQVMPDYLAVGTDQDFFRLPMNPGTALAIARVAGCTLLTAKISDDLHQAALLKLEPKPLTVNRDAPATFFQHQKIIEGQVPNHKHGMLVAGIKKDLVWSNRLKDKPNRVGIYGWHYPDGRPIQPLYTGHVDWYVDYSHGVRLIHEKVMVNGKEMKLGEVLKDPELHSLFSSEGPMDLEEITRATCWKIPR